MAHGELRSNTSVESDAERLLIEAAQRDPARFAELYEKSVDRVYAYIVRRVGDRDEAEDLTSEVFHDALAGLSRFEWRGVPFVSWLFKIARNAIIDRVAQAAKQNRGVSLEVSAVNLPEIDDQFERRAQLYQLVERLPMDQRRVVNMRFAEEKSIKEIATELGRTEGAVKQLQFRALEKLRAQLDAGAGITNE